MEERRRLGQDFVDRCWRATFARPIANLLEDGNLSPARRTRIFRLQDLRA
jgi:hypothetical protein